MIRALLSTFGRKSTESPAADAPADRSQLGAHAKRLLDDPVLALALNRIERDLTERLLATAVGDREAREASYRLYWAAQQLRAQLQTMLGNAKVIEAEQRRQDAAEAAEQRRRERAMGIA